MVFVPINIARVCNVSPRNVRVPIFYGVGQTPGSFGNDKKGMIDSVTSHRVILKVGKFHSRYELLNQMDCI